MDVLYTRGWDHFADELTRLDILIHMRMLQQGGEPAGEMDPFKGLVVSEEEVFRLLEGQRQSAAADGEILRLTGQLRELEQRIRDNVGRALAEGVFLPLPHLSATLGLSAFERQTLMICLAVELDRKYEKLFAYLQDDVTCKYATPDLAMKLLCGSDDERRAAYLSFSPGSSLQRYVLMKDEPQDRKLPLLSRPLKLDERILHYVLSPDEASEELASYCTLYRPEERLAPLLIGGELQSKLAGYCGSHGHGGQAAVCYLWGNEGAGKKLQAAHAARSLGAPLIVASVREMLGGTPPFETKLAKVIREAKLLGAVPAFEHVQELLEEKTHEQPLRELLEAVTGWSGVVFLLSEAPWTPPEKLRRGLFVSAELPTPPDSSRRMLWERLAEGSKLDESVDWDILAGKFQFTPGQIRNALTGAKQLAVWNRAEPTITSADLHAACLNQAQHSLTRKAVRIQPKYGWDDIILPHEQKQLLRNACNQMKYRSRVHGQWGFGAKLAYGKGLSMLFSGPPGTGKTMSAQVVARELQLELYKIDLSQMISKYIGETEKNLHEIFREARLSGAVLFFDEADALFGKRSEVKDANDKYANVETAYLLQKMEEYEGITILATNLLQNMDEAFMRRINFVIRFPFPDSDYRELLWRTVIPRGAPVDGDVDYAFLGSKLHLAGGHIKNIAMSAAFLAAETNDPIGMVHILNAAKHELQKSGRILPREELGIYEDLVGGVDYR